MLCKNHSISILNFKLGADMVVKMTLKFSVNELRQLTQAGSRCICIQAFMVTLEGLGEFMDAFLAAVELSQKFVSNVGKDSFDIFHFVGQSAMFCLPRFESLRSQFVLCFNLLLDCFDSIVN